MTDDDQTLPDRNTGAFDGRSGMTFDAAALTHVAALEPILTLTTASGQTLIKGLLVKSDMLSNVFATSDDSLVPQSLVESELPGAETMRVVHE